MQHLLPGVDEHARGGEAVDEDALHLALRAAFAPHVAGDLTPQRLRRFFVEEEGGYRAAKMLREMVVFARQDLIADPPFSH
ncbi:MAG TPA: hypothetical protein VFG50_11885, partial [Rhodothermales bacterium]|nr:hypothetical protein [Rhodothermales bacterium]